MTHSRANKGAVRPRCRVDRNKENNRAELLQGARRVADEVVSCIPNGSAHLSPARNRTLLPVMYPTHSPFPAQAIQNVPGRGRHELVVPQTLRARDVIFPRNAHAQAVVEQILETQRELLQGIAQMSEEHAQSLQEAALLRSRVEILEAENHDIENRLSDLEPRPRRSLRLRRIGRN
jgi:hypothetical protein